MVNNPEINAMPVVTVFTVTAAAWCFAGYFAWRRRLVLAMVCLGCFLALFRPSVAMSAELCVPFRYADGDTFTFLRHGDNVRARLAGYDAPERGQPFSQRATDKLRQLTQGGAKCQCYKEDRHGRSVCTVHTLAGENVATLMLEAGLACIDPRFENEAAPADRAASRLALEDAQRAKRGMWSQPDPLCAFDFRRSKNAK
jgi:endonuclease YncB( thermonuclease family)